MQKSNPEWNPAPKEKNIPQDATNCNQFEGKKQSTHMRKGVYKATTHEITMNP